jgi:hypothetical protein
MFSRGKLEHVLQCHEVTENGTGDSALPAPPGVNNVGTDGFKCKAERCWRDLVLSATGVLIVEVSILVLFPLPKLTFQPSLRLSTVRDRCVSEMISTGCFAGNALLFSVVTRKLVTLLFRVGLWR